MGLFVLIAVGVVVAQTWLDWSDSRKTWVLPDWVKGLALGGAVTICMTAAASYASVWLQDPASSWSSEVTVPRLFWPELGFLAVIMGIIVVAARKKRMRLALLLTGVVVIAYWLGMTLSS